MRLPVVWLIAAACSTPRPAGTASTPSSSPTGPAAVSSAPSEPAPPEAPAPEAPAAQAPDGRAGRLEITGHVSVTTLDEPTDEAVRQGQARFTIDNRGRELRRVKPREIELFHPEGCRAPARNPRSSLRIVDVYVIERDDEVLVPRELEIPSGTRIDVNIVFNPVQGHPRSCRRTSFRVVFVIDGAEEQRVEAGWVVETKPQ
jgi:hypothetical protein